MSVNQQSPIQNDEHLTNCLVGMLTTNNEARRECSNILKSFCTNSMCIVALLRQVQGSPKHEARVVASVLLRKQINKLWRQVPPQQSNFVKRSCLEILFKEKLPVIRNAIVYCVGEIGRYELPGNTWPELGNFLKNMVSSNLDGHRETGMMLFGVLLELVPGQMMRNVRIVVGVFSGGMKDRNENVRDATLKSMEFLISSVKDEGETVNSKEREIVFGLLRELIPGLFNCVNDIIKREDYKMMKIAFFLFDDIAEIRSDSLTPVLPTMVRFMIDIASNINLSHQIRISATDFIGWVFYFNAQIVIQSNLLGNCVKLGVNMLHSPDVEDYYTDETTVFGSGKKLISQICLKVPSNLVFQRLIDVAFQLIRMDKLTQRRAGITILAVMSEGCHDRISMNLHRLIPVMVTAAKSPDQQIRISGIDGILFYTENCKKHIRKFHGAIMPILVKSLEDPNLNLVTRVIFALDSYCGCLGGVIEGYSHELLQKLFMFLKHPNISVKSSALSALDSVARALGPRFEKYLPMTIQALTVFSTDKNLDQTGLLQVKAAETAGNISKAVGPNLFGPYLEQFMKFNITCVEENEDPEYREACFLCIGKFATVFGERFSAYVPGSMNVILRTIVSEVGSSTGFMDDDGDDMDTADYHSSAPDIQIICEKSEAITALGMIAISQGERFAPYFQKSVGVLAQSLEYFHMSIKCRAVVSLSYVVSAMIPRPIPNPMPPRCVTYLNNLMQIYNRLICGEEYKEVVEDVCESISSLCLDIGESVFNSKETLVMILKALRGLLDRRWICFQYDVKFPTMKDDLEQSDHDLLMDKVGVCIQSMARVLRKKMSDPFREFLYKPLMYYAKRSNPFDKSMCVATMIEIIKAIGLPDCLPFCKEMFRVCLVNVVKQDQNQMLLQNLFYSLGVLSELAPHVVHSDVLKRVINICVQGLTKEREKCDPEVMDNICGAVTRIMVMFRKTPDFPLRKILPPLLLNLPLKVDIGEAENVYGSLLLLINERNNGIVPFLGRVKEIFSFVLQDGRVKPDLKNRIVKTMKEAEQNLNSRQ